MIDTDSLKSLLDEKVALYECPEFIPPDPISIPHRYTTREDIEISALLASTIAWGNRKAIVPSAQKMMIALGDSPYDFVMSASESHISQLSTFVYRTFQHDDLPSFIIALRHIFTTHHSLEPLFTPTDGETIRHGIARFRAAMIPHMAPHSHKHIPDVTRGSAAKRLNMFLRWMVRPNTHGVDFGLWHNISPDQLIMPLDVHTLRAAQNLHLLNCNQPTWHAAEELTSNLRTFCPQDPVRYDFALFSIDME